MVGKHTLAFSLPGGVVLCESKAFSFSQAFPEPTTIVFCVCQHAELSVSLAGHHLTHPGQPPTRDPAHAVPQTPWTQCSTGKAETLCM